MHIFGIPRVHRVLLCIWFPHHMGVLTLLEVKTRRAVSKSGADIEDYDIIKTSHHVMLLTLRRIRACTPWCS